MTGPQLRRMADGTGPPPFVPFGSKKAPAPSRQDRNFRAMDSVRDAGAGRADDDADEDATREFQEHRKAVIEEARQQGGKEARSKLQNFAQQRVKLPPGRGVDQMEVSISGDGGCFVKYFIDFPTFSGAKTSSG